MDAGILFLIWLDIDSTKLEDSKSVSEGCQDY